MPCFQLRRTVRTQKIGWRERLLSIKILSFSVGTRKAPGGIRMPEAMTLLASYWTLVMAPGYGAGRYVSGGMVMNPQQFSSSTWSETNSKTIDTSLCKNTRQPCRQLGILITWHREHILCTKVKSMFCVVRHFLFPLEEATGSIR